MTTSIFSASWIDIVFDGRNQQYGAYELRRVTERNMVFAILLSVTVLSMAVNVLLLDNKPNGNSNIAIIDNEKDKEGERQLENIHIQPPAPPREPEVIPPQPPPTPPTTVAPSDKLTVPVIVADSTAFVDTVRAQEDFGDLVAAATKQKGDTGSFRIVAPPTSPTPTGPGWTTIAEIIPEFPGGEKALLRYLGENTDYPDNAKDVGIEGTVYVEFVVDIDGKLTNIAVAKGPHKWLNDEGIRVVKSMPKWKPGMQNGQPVRVKYVVPIRFELS